MIINEISSLEILFWKCFKNIYIKNLILSNLHNDKSGLIIGHQFQSIESLEWISNRKLFKLLKWKLKTKQFILVDSKGLESFFNNCKVKNNHGDDENLELYKLLWEQYKYEMDIFGSLEICIEKIQDSRPLKVLLDLYSSQIQQQQQQQQQLEFDYMYRLLSHFKSYNFLNRENQYCILEWLLSNNNKNINLVNYIEDNENTNINNKSLSELERKQLIYNDLKNSSIIDGNEKIQIISKFYLFQMGLFIIDNGSLFKKFEKIQSLNIGEIAKENRDYPFKPHYNSILIKDKSIDHILLLLLNGFYILNIEDEEEDESLFNIMGEFTNYNNNINNNNNNNNNKDPYNFNMDYLNNINFIKVYIIYKQIYYFEKNQLNDQDDLNHEIKRIFQQDINNNSNNNSYSINSIEKLIKIVYQVFGENKLYFYLGQYLIHYYLNNNKIKEFENLILNLFNKEEEEEEETEEKEIELIFIEIFEIILNYFQNDLLFNQLFNNGKIGTILKDQYNKYSINQLKLNEINLNNNIEQEEIIKQFNEKIEKQGKDDEANTIFIGDDDLHPSIIPNIENDYQEIRDFYNTEYSLIFEDSSYNNNNNNNIGTTQEEQKLKEEKELFELKKQEFNFFQKLSFYLRSRNLNSLYYNLLLKDSTEFYPTNKINFSAIWNKKHYSLKWFKRLFVPQLVQINNMDLLIKELIKCQRLDIFKYLFKLFKSFGYTDDDNDDNDNKLNRCKQLIWIIFSTTKNIEIHKYLLLNEFQLLIKITKKLDNQFPNNLLICSGLNSQVPFKYVYNAFSPNFKFSINSKILLHNQNNNSNRNLNQFFKFLYEKDLLDLNQLYVNLKSNSPYFILICKFLIKNNNKLN